MDPAAERKFIALKRRLDALHYQQPLSKFFTIFSHKSPFTAIDSAALAEKLLNDLLKTTEGFQRLKKMNEELKASSSV